MLDYDRWAHDAADGRYIDRDASSPAEDSVNVTADALGSAGKWATLFRVLPTSASFRPGLMSGTL